jgi:hypothetical protein
LDEIGRLRSLSIATSIDGGASLSKNVSIVAGGVKIIDIAARCPITERLLLENPATMSAQSRSLCIPLKIMMGRETNDTFQEYATLFKFFDDFSEEASIPEEMNGFRPFCCMTNCDLSAQWKGLCKGSAAKVHTLPCMALLSICSNGGISTASPNKVGRL